MEINRINQDDWSFEGVSGKRYEVCKEISAGRWAQFKAVQPKVIYGRSMEEIYTMAVGWFDILESGKPKNATMSAQIYNLISSIKDVDDRTEPVLELAAIICFEEGEDRVSEVSPERISEKMADFKNIDIRDFFLLAKTFIPEWTKSLNHYLNTFSKEKGE